MYDDQGTNALVIEQNPAFIEFVLVHFPAENMYKLFLLHLIFQRKTREYYIVHILFWMVMTKLGPACQLSGHIMEESEKKSVMFSADESNLYPSWKIIWESIILSVCVGLLSIDKL
jgi:uncharacterized membrane protein